MLNMTSYEIGSIVGSISTGILIIIGINVSQYLYYRNKKLNLPIMPVISEPVTDIIQEPKPRRGRPLKQKLPPVPDALRSVIVNSFDENIVPEKQEGNKVLNRLNTSGVKGIFWHNNRQQWQAQIQVNKEIVYREFFEPDQLKDAAIAISKKRKELLDQLWINKEIVGEE